MEIRGIDYSTGKAIRLQVAEGKITGAWPMPEGTGRALPYIAPGLVDLQVNGYTGTDFNTPPVQPEDVKMLTKRLWSDGVTSFLPTVVTGPEEHMTEALRQIAAACQSDPGVNSSIAGIHLEGPFISPDDGPRGAHDLRYVRPPDRELFLRLQQAARGKIRLITLAPEWPGMPAFITECVKQGVRVAIGHTAAEPEQIRAAVAAGASLSTHLGNGAHQLLPRHPNYIWEQLAEDRLWASLIADDFHLPDAVLRVFTRVKGNKVLLVSDATRFTGMAAGRYASPIGGEVELSLDGRLAVLDNPGTLAGSAQSLLCGINRLLVRGILPLKEAWDAASIKPMELLTGAPAEPFHTGSPANLVLFHIGDKGITISQTIHNGQSLSH